MVGMVITFGCASLFGIYLIAVSGWPILIIGLACILAALAYSGGPYPLGSHGYGELLVFIFFGPVPVCGTYYAQSLDLTWYVVLTSVPVGLLITAILVVNNVRDIETDRIAGKKSLAVMLGEMGTRIEYLLLMSVSYIFPIAFWLTGLSSAWVLLPLLSMPMSFYMIFFVWGKRGEILNKALAGTAQVSLIFSVLFAIGLVL
ncbi:1,4-dihydroxy-2-naphthoate octaprenyltransferase [Thermodesulfobacteriota bacterium]